MDSDRADEIRKRYLYRRLLLRGRISLPMQVAKKLLGPDCAYHLYRYRSRHSAGSDD